MNTFKTGIFSHIQWIMWGSTADLEVVILHLKFPAITYNQRHYKGQVLASTFKDLRKIDLPTLIRPSVRGGGFKSAFAPTDAEISSYHLLDTLKYFAYLKITIIHSYFH